jgi:hypothetical protein
VLALAPVIVAAMPNRLALSLTSAALAARILDHFRFLARETRLPTSSRRARPASTSGSGTSPRPRPPRPARAPACRSRPPSSRPTPSNTPFIFEGLKNYFGKAGLRVELARQRQLHLHRRRPLPPGVGGAAPPRQRGRDGGLHGSAAPAGGVPRASGGGGIPHPAGRGRRPALSSTSTTATTPRPSTTWSPSMTS